VTDAGLAPLRQMSRPQALHLGSSKLTCADFGPIPELRTLSIKNSPQVGDSAMQRVAQHKPLSRLFVENSKVADAGVAHLQKLRLLELLDLNCAQNFSDKSCVYVTALPKLKQLTLHGTAVTDEGVAQLSKFNSLETLNLGELHQVTDNSLEYLLNLPNLKNLQLEGSGVTLRGIAQFKQMRPACNITKSSFSDEEIKAEIRRLD